MHRRSLPNPKSTTRRSMTAQQIKQTYSRSNPEYSSKNIRKRRRTRSIAIGAVGILLVALIGCGAAFASFVGSANQNLIGSKTDDEMTAIQNALVDRKNTTDPFYMLLLGSDARANDASMGARADTSIVARIDPKTNTITLISIPRDTKIIYKGGTEKFNAAYSYDGAAGAINAASELLDIEISHYAEVNFESLVSLVDAVGGVEVDVPRQINDWMAGDVVIEKGLQTLDGEAALVFARSRAYVDGDFTRTSNQRLLIEALAKKALSLPLDQMPAAIRELAKCVSTDLGATDIVSLATQFTDNDGDLTIYSSMVPSTTTDINGISYVVADETGLANMMKIVEEGGDPNDAETYGAKGSSLSTS